MLAEFKSYGLVILYAGFGIGEYGIAQYADVIGIFPFVYLRM